MDKNNVGMKDILKMEPFELTVWLTENFTTEIPLDVNTAADLERIANMMAGLTNQYSYLMSVLSFLKILAKEEKKKDKTSKETEDMMQRRDSFQAQVDIVKQQYNAISRILTVRQEINREMQMY